MRSALCLSCLPRAVLMAIVLGPGMVIHGQVPAPESAPAAPRPTRDEGLLDPAWFSSDDLEFRQSGRLDYLWVRPGFTLEGRNLQFMPWTAPVLPSGRDEKDRATAEKLNQGYPPRLAEVFAEQLAGKAKVVAADGDLRVVGRIVDCNAGAMFVGPSHTFELKFVDGEGTLQVAIHSRLMGQAGKISIGSWAKTIAKPFAEGIEGVWRAAKPSEP